MKVLNPECILIKRNENLEGNDAEEEKQAIELQDQGIILVLGNKKSYESLATYIYLVLRTLYPDLIPYGPYNGHGGVLIQALVEDLDNGVLQDLEIGTKPYAWLAYVLSYEMDKQQPILNDEEEEVCSSYDDCNLAKFNLPSPDQIKEMYDKASSAYQNLSELLGDQTFFFGERPTNLDALFIEHALFVLYQLPRDSDLQKMLLQHDNLVTHANNHGQEVLGVTATSWTTPKDFKSYQLCYFTQEPTIGEGRFGEVYKGWIWGINNMVIEGIQVAVKVSPNKTTFRLNQWKAEVQCGSKLRHKNIIKVLGHYEDENKLYIIYEYMQNDHLGHRYEGLDWPKTKRIARGITLAVEYMHKQIPALINRDLKLNNILLDKDFNPKVSDFGLVREEGDNLKYGTKWYTDEKSLNEGIGTKETDMHNVGVILLQLITKYPYQAIGKKVGEQFKEGKIVFNEDLKKTGCDEDTARVIIEMALQCLHEELDKRPNISQVVEKLNELFKED